jgi:CDGSH-type Zn-finger protein
MRDEAREIVLTDEGPLLVSGPVEVVLPDGRRVRSDRPVSALCTCRRSRRQPFCDTSHRRKVRHNEGEGRAQQEPTGAL